jgi:hypothetical protein
MNAPTALSADDVRIFQRSAYDHLGAPLKVDGQLGPRTQWAMALAGLPSARVAIVSRAQGELGLEEFAGTNRHPNIDAWLRRCGAPLGSPWCAAFASWCISAGTDVVAVAGACNLGRRFPNTENPIPGDMFWYPTDNQGHGHCGIVVGVTLSEVMCIEGNQRNAVRCTRRSRDSLNFSRTAPACPGAALPGIPPGVPFLTSTGLGTR